MSELAENVEEMYVIMCADPSDKLVQQALAKVPWEERKKELGIKREIGEEAWQLAGEIIKAQCAGDEKAWQYACQVIYDGDYDDGEIEDAIYLQYNALKRILREAKVQ